MRFFVSATNEAGDDFIAREISAGTFEDAVEALRVLAREKWAGQIWRPTSVTAAMELDPARRPGKQHWS